ncbi:MAG: tetratricopeptide repeat protein [Polyangiaceae bacterium]
MIVRRHACALVAALAVVTAGSPARATGAEDKAAAEVLFNDAQSLMAHKDYEGACAKFAESLKLDPGIGVTLHLADCYEKQGKPASAWATFEEARELATKEGDTTRADVAARHAATLEPTLSTLTVTVTGVVPGLVVTRNGVQVGQAQWGIAVPVDPGPQVIAAEAPGYRRWETTTHVPGDHSRAVVTLPELVPLPPSATPSPSPEPLAASPSSAASPAGPPPPQASSVMGTRKILGLAVGGAGVVGIGVGIARGLVAASKLSDSDANGHCIANTPNCDATGAALRDDAKSAATASTVAFIVGGVAVAAGVLLYVTAPSSKVSVGMTGYADGREGGVLLRGSW